MTSLTKSSAAAIAATTLFLLVSLYVRHFDITGAAFDRSGPALFLYNASRVGLAACLVVACTSIGYWACRTWLVETNLDLTGVRRGVIVWFFAGASIYGLVFSALGLTGLISTWSAYLALTPALLFSFRLFEVIAGRGTGTPLSAAVRGSVDQTLTAEKYLIWLALAAGALAIAALLATRIVFLPNPDGNTWEHYLHYFRVVDATGSTQPNEIWHHFFNSKGSGLSFLAIAVSDVFSVQIVSGCFLAMATVIIFDLLIDYSRSTAWALLGVSLYLTFLFGDVMSGTLFRVHAVILGYTSFALWAAVRLEEAQSRERTQLLVASALSLFYAGFYQPVLTAVLAPFFLLLGFARTFARQDPGWRTAVALSAFTVSGTLTVLLLNWILTGLIELTPIKLMWRLADKAKVMDTFGLGGIDFFLAVNNNLQGGGSWLSSIGQAIRFPLSSSFLHITFFAALIAVWHLMGKLRSGQKPERAERLLLALVMFLAPLVVFKLLIRSPSIDRMGIYSLVPVTIAIAVLWPLCLRTVFSGRGFMFYGSGDTRNGSFVRVAAVAGSLLVTLAIAGSFRSAWRDLVYFRAEIFRFDVGLKSLKKTMERMEVKQRFASGMTVRAIDDFRAQERYNGKILSVAYDPSFAYFLPGQGVISEPTYALVRDPVALKRMPARDVAAYLGNRHIRYVAINLTSRLFSTVAFTQLFNPVEMGNNFRLAYSDGDLFVLELDAGRQHELPEYLLTVMDLKRSGSLHFPFSQSFADRHTNVQGTVRTMEGFERSRTAFIANVKGDYARHVLSALSREESRKLLRSFLAEAEERLMSAKPTEILPGAAANYDGAFKHVDERELRAALLDSFRRLLLASAAKLLGGELVNASAQCDERFPYGDGFEVDTSCN